MTNKSLLCSFYVSFCAFLWLKNPFNQRNLRLINDLRSTKVYVRNYKLFLQNEPKFRKVKLNVNKVLTKDYDKMDTWSIRKNEPKQSQTSKRQKTMQTSLPQRIMKETRFWATKKQTQKNAL